MTRLTQPALPTDIVISGGQTLQREVVHGNVCSCGENRTVVITKILSGKNFAVERGFANFAGLPEAGGAYTLLKKDYNEIIDENIDSDGSDAVCTAGLAGAVRRTEGAPRRAEGRQRGAALHR